MKKVLALLLCVIMILSFASTALAFTSVPVKSISLDTKNLELKVGRTYNLKVTLQPSNTTQKLLRFSTNNSKIATVDSKGKITAVGTGRTTITVSSVSNNAVLTRCSVNVSPKDTGKLKMIVINSSSRWNELHNSPIQKEIKKVTGVTLDLIETDQNRLDVILASGDLPDMLRIDRSKNNIGDTLIKGNHVLALDNLLKTNGQELLKSIPETLEYSKVNWSANTNKTYYVPVQVGVDAIGLENDVAPVLRWDYYKELGAPAFDNEDELLDILTEMVDRHPTTPDGKKVYGVSMWNDWGNWMYFMPLFPFTGLEPSAEACAISTVTANNKITNALTTDQSYWRSVEFFYKAQKMGLLDPDALTMKYGDFEAKATAGQILYGPATWPFANFNQKNAKDKKGYIAIPMNTGYQWHGDIAHLGWAGKAVAISTDCKKPELAMDLMNYLWSYDGCRTLYSGIEGTNWNRVNGKPVLTDATITAYSKHDVAWENTNINFDANLIGLAPNTIHPVDGEPLNLFNTSQVLKMSLNALQKDFSDSYGVTYPGEAFKKNVAMGKNKNKAPRDPFAMSVPAPQTDELKRIQSNLASLMGKHAAKCILAKSDEEFKTLKAQAVKEFEQAGLTKLFDWRYQWYENAKEIAKQYRK